MNDVELKGHAHESGEFLHSGADFLHDLVRGGGGDEGGETEVGGVVVSGGQGFEERRPLGAIGVADVNYV